MSRMLKALEQIETLSADLRATARTGRKEGPCSAETSSAEARSGERAPASATLPASEPADPETDGPRPEPESSETPQVVVESLDQLFEPIEATAWQAGLEGGDLTCATEVETACAPSDGAVRSSLCAGLAPPEQPGPTSNESDSISTDEVEPFIRRVAEAQQEEAADTAERDEPVEATEGHTSLPDGVVDKEHEQVEPFDGQPAQSPESPGEDGSAESAVGRESRRPPELVPGVVELADRVLDHAVPLEQVLLLLTGADAGAAGADLLGPLGTAIWRRTECEVLVVDADTRHAGLAEHFGVVSDRGLPDWLLGTASLDEVTCVTEWPGVYLLPGQPFAGIDQSLGGRFAADSLADLLKQRFAVVFCYAPVPAALEHFPLISQCDGAYLFVALGTTRAEEANDAARQIRRLGAQLIGTIALDPTHLSVLPRDR